MNINNCATGTHLNNNTPSDTSEGQKTQTGDQHQAETLQENVIPDVGIALFTMRYPSSPDKNFYWTEGANSIQHEIRQLMRFDSVVGIKEEAFYFDVVQNLETGELRIRLDALMGVDWRNLERLDCESISAAIKDLMADNYLNAIMLNEHSVVNCAPDILNKSQIEEIINAGLLNRPEVAASTLSEFMEERYEEDESEYDNAEIYNRVF